MAHIFDDIQTERPLTHDLLGGITRKWEVIAADPPWAFNNWSEEGEDRNANQHYDTMPIEEIMKLPVEDIAADDCALLLWVTDPTLAQAIKLIESWGFEYKTVAFVWAKTYESTNPHCMDERNSFPIGTGYLTRANCEMMLYASRGVPKRRLLDIDGQIKKDMSIRRLQFGARTQHSAKPAKFYDLIDRMFVGEKLELFARNRRPGWACWGNQTSLLDAGPVKTKRRKDKRKAAPAPLIEGI